MRRIIALTVVGFLTVVAGAMLVNAQGDFIQLPRLLSITGNSPDWFHTGVLSFKDKQSVGTAFAVDTTSTAQGVRVGGGTLVKGILTATATLDPASITSPECAADLTITVTGAADGDAVIIQPVNAGVAAKMQAFGWVSAANTVSVRVCAFAGTSNAASAVWRAVVIKY